ncbi:DUF523 domain-containing protein [Thermanaeromonas sp. C210]|uniref:DUF523 domain-containing protein n=1 Tax=Thermanaeromonas sp. C210 TaxID=2731925 RepID=UPI00155C3124|nr:DUF523 domain-containing protein [Thermanaeromonas sp. C210]GFN22498.1 hypothetical protein TAMC210_08140 [Thermanaeromonas sp. C210]
MKSDLPPVLVSACLAGCQCRYDGGANPVPAIRDLVVRGKAIPVCPERLGGLPVPRPPAEIQGGDGRDVLQGQARVVNNEGVDVTPAFIAGARATLEVARRHGTLIAILKERSPSCGSTAIYDGSFRGQTRPGQGVTAALLHSQGIKLFNEETWKKQAPCL